MRFGTTELVVILIVIIIMITQAVAMLCYIVYPSIQNLRPESFPRQNVFTAILGFIYSFDTPTGVCRLL